MVTLTSTLATLVFSAEMPDLTIATASESVGVSLLVDTEVVYSTQLYSADGSLTIYNLREVIEEFMRERSLGFVRCTLSFTETESGDELHKDFDVLFSTLHIDEPIVDWIQQNFLTTLAMRRTSRSVREELRYFERYSGDTTARYRITLRYGDTYRTIVLTDTPSQQEDDGINTIVASYSEMKRLVKNAPLATLLPDLPAQTAANPDEVLAWTVQVGARSASFFLDDAPVEVSMLFYNCFNVPEFAHFSATTVAKSKVSRSEATQLGKTVYYDYHIEKTFEVESGPLTREEAGWLEQLPLSRAVSLARTDTADISRFVPVLICNAEVSISDSDEEVNTIKFSWRYYDELDRLPAKARTSNIFTSPFDKTFK